MVGCIDICSDCRNYIFVYGLIVCIKEVKIAPPNFAGCQQFIQSFVHISINKQLFSQLEVDMVGHIFVLSTPPLFTPLGYWKNLYSFPILQQYIFPCSLLPPPVRVWMQLTYSFRCLLTTFPFLSRLRDSPYASINFILFDVIVCWSICPGSQA